jgi:WXXGXW repeat (2 copies)
MRIQRVRSVLLALVVLVMSAASFGQIGISVTFAPPALPVYEQPLCPGEGYLWAPGYWAYDADDYYWVPGTWVLPPEEGLLWTPGYWGWGGNGFVFYDGFWATQVGFYGGINYGFGYFGEGYEGGRWDNGRFFYNRSVNNINVTNIHNVYNTTVINNVTVNRVSYNGGNGGITARPRREDETVAHERHVPPVAAQTQHLQAARSNPEQRASVNQGKPPVAATPKPGDLRDREAMPAKEAGAPYNPERNRSAAQPLANASETRSENDTPRPASVVHANDIPRTARPDAPSTGNPKMDQKYQQQQEKMQAKQDQERQKLQQKQDRDHQQMAQRNADEARKQQIEQKHQQQTQQLQQRQEQQQQKIQQRIQQRTPPNPPQEKR